MAEGFLDSDEGKIIARSKQFLFSAAILKRSPEYSERPKLMLAPILHVAAHGIELLLKFPHFKAGIPEAKIRSTYAHDLKKLWLDQQASAIRELAWECADLAWQEARASGHWEDQFTEDPKELIEQFLFRLSELHGKDTNFGLRYMLPAEATGPRPGLLVDTFLDVSDRILKNPGIIDR